MSDREVKISVIVPVFNAEKFIEKCVRSITSQTCAALEILLVDDGSSDNTPALLSALAREDARIRVLRKENGGAASARNLGLLQATGEYVGFVDADDRIASDMYEKLLSGFAAARDLGHDPGRILVQTGRIETDEEGRRLADDVTPPGQTVFVPSEDFVRELLLWKGDSSFCTKLVPRALFAGRGFPEGRLGEDFRLHMDMLPAIEGVLLLPERGYYVTHRAGSATRRKDADHFSRAYEDIVVHADAAAEMIRERFPVLREEAEYFALRTRLLYLLHVPVSDMKAGNDFYQRAVRYLRKNRAAVRTNSFLSGKERRQLAVLTAAPGLSRRIHRILRAGKLR